MTSLKTPKQSNRKKTVLQVVPSLIAGGVERGTVDIAKELVDKGYGSFVTSAGGPLASKVIECGAEHIRLKVASKNPAMMWLNAKSIAKLINKYKVDIIHARSRAPAWSAYMAAKATGAKFITTFHGIYNFDGHFKKYYNSIMTKGERVIAVSDFVKAHIMEQYGVEEERIRVIHRGVDHNYFDPAKITPEYKARFAAKYHVPRDVPIILLPARMTRWKGQMVLVEALNLLRDQNFYCMMVGDLSKHPNFTHRVQDKIVSYKLQSKVQLFGPEMDMLGLYGLADIVLSTSIEPEAFGRVVIEAQAMERQVIATNIGGSAETIEDGVTGYHIKTNDAAELAEKIKQVLSILGTPKAAKIGEAARSSAVKQFSLDSMLKKTLAVYEEL